MSNLELIEEHDNACSFCSVMGHMRRVSPTYKSILEKGNSIVPDILKYLEDEEAGMSVMMLLWDITKQYPYKPDRVGSMPMMAFNVSDARRAWIEWGKNNKL